MDNEFDPDNFDWEGDGIAVGEGNGIFESLREYALDTLGRPDPVRFVKPSLFKQDRPQPIYQVRYSLSDTQKQWLEDAYRGWQFDYSDGKRHHDHPLSHMGRELDEYEMVSEFRGERYIDLYGNPGRNAKWGRGATTLYSMASAKDYLRYYNKRGAQPFDLQRLLANGYRDCGEVTLTHALYYLNLSDLARICHSGRRVHALVHRHELSHGWLNNREQEYWVEPNGDVTQVNVDTGERYTHPTLEPFFHQTTARTEFGGVVWDIKKCGPDSYILNFVACPNEKCEKFRTLSQLGSSDAQVVVIDDITVHSFFGYTWYTKGSGSSAIQLTDIELLEKLRRYIAGRERSSSQWTNLMNFCRRNCNKNDIISMHGGSCHTVPADQMVDYVNAAFYMDVKRELESAVHHVREIGPLVSALNQYYESGTLPTHIVTPAEVIETVVSPVRAIASATAKAEKTARDRLKVATPLKRDWVGNAPAFPRPVAMRKRDEASVPVTATTGMWKELFSEANVRVV